MKRQSEPLDISIDMRIFNPVYFPHSGLPFNLSIDERRLFEQQYPELDLNMREPRRVEIFYGGASSGKSYFLADRCVLDVLNNGRNYLVLRKVAKAARRTCFAQVRQSIEKLQLSPYFKIREQDMDILCKASGRQIYFGGIDDPEKIKSTVPLHGSLTDVWIEEATESAEEDFNQLRLRLRGNEYYNGKEIQKRIVMSFNPIYQGHWIYKRFFEGFFGNEDKEKEDKVKNYRILKTTYKDNAFLTDDDKQVVESSKEGFWYDVYALGNWGVLGDVIYTNWTVEDLSDRRDLFDYYFTGLDFGYANDPTAVVRAAKLGNTIYVTHVPIYSKKLTNYDIAEILKPIVGNDIVTCDSAEPKSIEELRLHGINAVGAVKGRDSVLHGIQWLQQHDIVVHDDLQDIINEFEVYQWKEDVDGHAISIPQDKNNHALDALRYAFAGHASGERFKNCSWK